MTDHDKIAQLPLPPKPPTVLEPERIYAELFGGKICSREDHPRERMWLTRKMVHCPDCHLSLSRKSFPEIAAEVEAINPKVHCNNWCPGDPPDKHHAPRCFKKYWQKPDLRLIDGGKQ